MTRLWTARPRQSTLWRAFFIVGVLANVNCQCDDRVRGVVNQTKAPPVASQTNSVKTFEREPNDAPESATSLRLGKELRPLPADLGHAADVDWFELTSAVADEELVELRVVPEGKLNVSLHLLHGPTALPLTYDVGGAGETESVAVLRIGKRPIAFAIRAVGDTSGTYHIEVSRRLGDGLEAEPNDDVSVAQDVRLPGDLQGLVDRPDDRDVLKLPSAESLRRLRLEYEPVQGIAQVFRVFDSERFEVPLVAMQFGGMAGERGQVPAFEVEPGVNLFFVVTTTGGFDRRAPYLLRLAELEDVSAAVEVEPNDVKPRPIEVPGDVQGSFYAAEDLDRFVLGAMADPLAAQGPGAVGNDAGLQDAAQRPVSPVPRDAAALDLGWADAGVADVGTSDAGEVPYDFVQKRPNGAPLNVRVESLRTENTLGVSVNTPAGVQNAVLDARTPSVEFCEAAYRPGEVEVSVRPVQLVATGKGFDYRVQSTLMTGEDFEVEPNDALANADQLVRRRRGTIARAGDADVFGFRVVTESQEAIRKVRLKVEGPHPLSAELVDLADGLISAVETRMGPEIEVDLPAGVYFLKVRGTVASCQPYDVVVTF